MLERLGCVAIGTLLLISTVPAAAQEAPPTEQEQPAAAATGGDDVAEVVTLPSADEQIDVAAINVPALDGKPDPLDANDYDKYYYFRRADTDFKAALADLRDCDGLSRGLTTSYGNAAVPYPYAGTLAGGVGGAIGSMMAVAIFGSAEKRAQRRVNMRRCMFYKGYQRYGIGKDVWKQFNFEEGFGSIEEAKRQAFLKQQAKIASGPAPIAQELGK